MKNRKTFRVDETEWKSSFGPRLDSLILSRGLTPNSVSSQTEIDGKSLRSYTRMESVPTATKIQALASCLGVSCDYLILGHENKVGFSPAVIASLGGLAKDCKMTINWDESTSEELTIKVQDRILSIILTELILAEKNDSYDELVKNMIRAYGGCVSLNGELMPYSLYRNLVKQKFLYQDHDTSESLHAAAYADLQLRLKQWDQMDEEEHETWWKLYSAGQYDDAEDVVNNRKVQESPDPEESEED